MFVGVIEWGEERLIQNRSGNQLMKKVVRISFWSEEGRFEREHNNYNLRTNVQILESV